MTDQISGFWVATATPLTAAGAVDHASLAGHAKNLFRQGVAGVVLFGTTGEGTSFSIAERIDTVAALLKSGIDAGRMGSAAAFPPSPTPSHWRARRSASA